MIWTPVVSGSSTSSPSKKKSHPNTLDFFIYCSSMFSLHIFSYEIACLTPSFLVDGFLQQFHKLSRIILCRSSEPDLASAKMWRDKKKWRNKKKLVQRLQRCALGEEHTKMGMSQYPLDHFRWLYQLFWCQLQRYQAFDPGILSFDKKKHLGSCGP